MNQIKPIEYESIIVNEINKVYKNFKANCSEDFLVPKNILKYFDEYEKIKNRVQFEEFCRILDNCFEDWKVHAENADKSIILNHLISYLQNSLIALRSIDANLEKEGQPKQVITTKIGLDLVVATAVQMMGQKSIELVRAYDDIGMKNDPLIIFAKTNEFLISVADLSATEAFTKLMENILGYIKLFKDSYSKLSQLEIDDFTDKRIDLFMKYLDAYYLYVIMLRLVLTYPLQEGLLEKNIFENIIPNIELY